MLRVVKRGGKLYVSGTLLGSKVLKSTGLSVGYEREAEKMRLEIERSIVDGEFNKKAPTYTFRQAAKEYMSWKRVEGKGGKQNEWYVQRQIDFFKDTKLDEINEDSIRKFVADVLGGRSAGTVRRNLVALRAVLNDAHNRGWCNKIRFKMPYVDDARDEHLEEDEIQDVLAWVKQHRPHQYPALCLLIDTGLRCNEALRLDWRDVRDGVVFVKRVVNGKARTRVVPMSERLRDALGPKGTGSVLTGEAGKTYPNGATAMRMWREALNSACEQLAIPRVRLHDLRHTFAYQAGANGIDLGDLQKLMGHSNISMTMRYRGFIASRALDVISKFGAVRDTSKEERKILGSEPTWQQAER